MFVFRQVLALYGSSMSFTVDELVNTDLQVESQVIERFEKYIEVCCWFAFNSVFVLWNSNFTEWYFLKEGKKIAQLKEKLKTLTLDMDSAKRRWDIVKTLLLLFIKYVPGATAEVAEPGLTTVGCLNELF